MFDYEKAWDNLKKEIQSKKESYRSGAAQSTAESVQGEKTCQEILDIMNNCEMRAVRLAIVRNNSHFDDDMY